EARRQALLKLGGVEQTKERVRDARGTRPLEAVARDLRLAVRRLVREPGFSIPTVATIALGIGVTTAVFVLVNAVLLRPLPYPDADRLVELRHAAPRLELSVTGLSPGLLAHYREHNRAFTEIGAYTTSSVTLTGRGAPEQVRIAYASPGLFTVLGATPHVGRFPTAAEVESGGGSGVVISHDLWVRRYGADPEIVGRTVEIDRRRQVVLGVAGRGFHFPHPETQVWIAGRIQGLVDDFGGRAQVGGGYISAVGRLAPDVRLAEAVRDIDRLIRSLPDAFPDVTAAQLEEWGFHGVVVPLKETVVGDVRLALVLLLATAGFLLLITWANAVNLSLVRAERQRREVAVQHALGATDGRLALRFAGESFVIAALGGVLALALACLAVELRFGFEPGQIPRLREVALGGAGLGLAAGLSLLTGALLAAVSLVGTRRPGGASALAAGHGRMTAGRREQTGRRLLVAGQVALALALLVGSGLMAQSYWRLSQVEPGFDPGGALTFSLPLPPSLAYDDAAGASLHHEVRERLRALPGVEAVEAATTSVFPLTSVPDHYISGFAAVEAPPTDSAATPDALWGSATPGYFRTMGIPLLRGRPFRSGAGGEASTEVVLSEALARALFDGANPVGRRVRHYSGEHVVVGVVGSVPGRSIREGPSMAVYFANAYPTQELEGVRRAALVDQQYVVRTSRPPLSLVPAIRRSIHQIDPKLLVTRVGTLEGLVDDSMARARLTMLLLLVGASTALLLGVIGIYGVLAYTVRRRTAELGVRIALGARPAGVTRMVLRQGALLALAGIAVGLAAAFALTRFLGGLLYEVRPHDPATFAAMAALLFAVALVASYLPARR
ncbi:MAG: ABC transporter permease, partial [Gemmatimonadota bacterium]